VNDTITKYRSQKFNISFSHSYCPHITKVYEDLNNEGSQSVCLRPLSERTQYLHNDGKSMAIRQILHNKWHPQCKRSNRTIRVALVWKCHQTKRSYWSSDGGGGI